MTREMNTKLNSKMAPECQRASPSLPFPLRPARHMYVRIFIWDNARSWFCLSEFQPTKGCIWGCRRCPELLAPAPFVSPPCCLPPRLLARRTQRARCEGWFRTRATRASRQPESPRGPRGSPSYAKPPPTTVVNFVSTTSCLELFTSSSSPLGSQKQVRMYALESALFLK